MIQDILQTLQRIALRTPLFYPLRNWLTRKGQAKALRQWEAAGRPVPPPHMAKQQVLRSLGQQHNLEVLIETGTYFGDMVEAMKGSFGRIISIELSPTLAAKAARRFRASPHVQIRQGDSATELGRVMKEIQQPALFWLDGHYSAGVTAKGEKDTPIFEELQHIFAAADVGHVLVIDDAHCFGSAPGYPTIDELKAFILSRSTGVQIAVVDNMICVTPGK